MLSGYAHLGAHRYCIGRRHEHGSMVERHFFRPTARSDYPFLQRRAVPTSRLAKKLRFASLERSTQCLEVEARVSNLRKELVVLFLHVVAHILTQDRHPRLDQRIGRIALLNLRD